MAVSILRLPEVRARVGLSRSSIYAYLLRGDFPRPIELGPRCVGWRADEIDDWISSRARRCPACAAKLADDTLTDVQQKG